MINVELQRFTLDSYAQGPPGAGSWMELVDRHLPDPLTPPGPLSGTLPPFTDFDDSWGKEDPFEVDFNSKFLDTDVEWDTDDDGDCECEGAPPPVFNLPPPPPPPVQESHIDGPKGVSQIGEEKENEEDSSSDVRWGVGPTKYFNNGDCKDNSPSPQDACPALLIAGDAHVRPRIHPPIAALLVAAVTFAFVIGIAAVVCWRFRKQRNRQGSTKSTSDLTNGVIYEDLPSGPTPRGLPPHGHDTCTLAPMELLDLKMASQFHTSTYGTQERGPCQILLPSNSLLPSTTTATINPTSQVVNSYSHFTNPYNRGSPRKSQRIGINDYPYLSKNPCGDYIYNHPSARDANAMAYSQGNYKEYQDFIKNDYEEPTGKKPLAKSSQELYNPTYEEISSGSDSTSVSSDNSSRKKSLTSSPKRSPTKKSPGSWSPTPCPCVVNNPSSTRKGGRPRSQKFGQNVISSSAFMADEYPDDSPTHLYVVPPPIPPPALYTIPGTSDGRTSTSSSSDHPPERGREPRYYVGPSSIKSPVTPPDGYSSQYIGTPPQLQEKLPPLPSRSDRYRIFFTTDRKRALQNRGQTDSKTLDLASRKRNRSRDYTLSNENEPLYHEL